MWRICPDTLNGPIDHSRQSLGVKDYLFQCSVMLTDLLSLSSTDLMSLSSTDLLSPGSQRGCDIVTTGEFVQVIAILPDHVVVRKAHPAEIMPTPARLPAGHLVASTILLHAKAEQPGGKEISRVGRQMIETKRLSAPWMNPVETIPESSHTSVTHP